MTLHELVELAASLLEAAGVGAILIGVTVATVVAAVRGLRRQPFVYRDFRRMIGRSILLGLEFLVGADIIRTVAVTPTSGGIALLAAIIAIRTFLSISLELEITGRFPWQAERPAATPAERPAATQAERPAATPVD